LVPTGAVRLTADGRADGRPWIAGAMPRRAIDPELVAALVRDVRSHPKGIITAGWGSGVTPETMRRFTRAAGWPVLADALSNLRSGHGVIDAYEALVRTPGFTGAHRPTIALRIGGLLTSKMTNQWLDPQVPQVLVDPYDTWIDPARPMMRRILAAPEFLLAGAADVLEAEPASDEAVRTVWVQGWADADHAARTAIDKLLASWADPFDGRVARDLAAGVPDGTTMLVASSMPVRDLDWFASPRIGVRIEASRGTNGIDGFASTLLGLATGTGAPVVGLCGDLAFLHDVNGLLGAEQVPGLNAVLVVIDNNGGGIFSFLPQAELPAHYETLWGTPHNRDLAAVAVAYGATVSRVVDATDLLPLVETALAAGGLHVVIVTTDRERNVVRHREIWDAAARALTGAR
jgi:2-succinyl-5-enolpyruvyl-6-hydroxy-3-cyclohexene-1-carboxylate synthase